MAEGFDDFEIQDLGKKFPEYDQLDDENLNTEYEDLFRQYRTSEDADTFERLRHIRDIRIGREITVRCQQ